MPEDAVLQRGKRMFHCRSPQPHYFRRGALIHALQRGFVQVPCHETPGTSCTATLEGAGSADLRLSCINHGAIFARKLFAGESLANRAIAGYMRKDSFPLAS